MEKYIVLTEGDNVGVALKSLSKGETLNNGLDLILREDIPAGHKFAVRNISDSEMILKYGAPIGHATKGIEAGSWVHVHNTKTNLKGEEEYRYDRPEKKAAPERLDDLPTFMGYRRPNGKVGIRNEIWVVPTVGCVNRLAERLAQRANRELPEGVELAVAFPHPHGCSQLGDDHENTRRILANLALHPNAGGVLFVGLGCENNIISDFRALVESHADRNPNIEYMIAQDEGDEMEAGMARLHKLMATAGEAYRQPVPVSELCIGLKCGGSDGLSGITANPLLGAFSDWLTDRGGSTLLTEVPEMFGAEKTLLNRSADSTVFRNGVRMINGFKRYFERYGQTIYENPSPGNKDGGITTLEDKSLGCTQKGGTRLVVDVLPYGGVVRKPGVTLMAGPGNDIVTVSELAAAGAHMVLFSTGRGTPLGAPVPVLKVASNTDLALRKPQWIDFDANPMIASGRRWETLRDFTRLILDVASGQRSKSELQESHDFAIFKDGVTL